MDNGGLCGQGKFVVSAFVICHIIIDRMSIISNWALSQGFLPACWPYTICIVLLYTMRLTKRVSCGTTMSDSLESR